MNIKRKLPTRARTVGWLALSETDDYLTRTLIDSEFYWIQTRKVNKGYRITVTARRDTVLKLLKRYVTEALRPDVSRCLASFMRLPATRSLLKLYMGDEFTLNEIKKHMRKYIELYLPDCGFELCTTDRYEIKTGVHETCVTSKKKHSPGDEIKFLAGTFAELSPEEEALLDKSDFSVINLSSRANPCLMLGPTRFINHDCDANARFASSSKGMRVFATKIILPGQEITVSYSPNYFGKDNKDCLCATCERLHKGYYDPNKYMIPSDADVIDISSSDGEQEVDNSQETEIIVINSETDTEYNKRSSSKSESTTPEVQEASKNHSSDITMENSHSAIRDKTPSEEESIEPESEEVGGRRLRPRQGIKIYQKKKLEDNILRLYPKDKSTDSLFLDGTSFDEATSKKRQINRTLHKLYNQKLYNQDFDKSLVYDCKHCGAYFKLILPSLHIYKDFCPRCTRHQLVFNKAWPQTIRDQQGKTLPLDPKADRLSIKQVEDLKDYPVSIRKIARNGGIIPTRRKMKDGSIKSHRRRKSCSLIPLISTISSAKVLKPNLPKAPPHKQVAQRKILAKKIEIKPRQQRARKSIKVRYSDEGTSSCNDINDKKENNNKSRGETPTIENIQDATPKISLGKISELIRRQQSPPKLSGVNTRKRTHRSIFKPGFEHFPLSHTRRKRRNKGGSKKTKVDIPSSADIWEISTEPESEKDSGIEETPQPLLNRTDSYEASSPNTDYKAGNKIGATAGSSAKTSLTTVRPIRNKNKEFRNNSTINKNYTFSSPSTRSFYSASPFNSVSSDHVSSEEICTKKSLLTNELVTGGKNASQDDSIKAPTNLYHKLIELSRNP